MREVCPPLGLEWRRYRRRSARHRVDARRRELGLPDYDAYLERVRADPEEARELADRMRVTITRFLREREIWEGLVGRVIPALVALAPPAGPFRAWSAGCAGGEEPYSLAIAWEEEVALRHPSLALELLATDIDDTSLARAALGRYQSATLRELPEAWRARWFRAVDGEWELSSGLRRRVAFERHNLMTDPLPTQRELVLCRYLAFTYYVGERREAAAARIARVLRPGGALMLGAKEEPLRTPWFESWPQAPAIYRRTAAASTA